MMMISSLLLLIILPQPVLSTSPEEESNTNNTNNNKPSSLGIPGTTQTHSGYDTEMGKSTSAVPYIYTLLLLAADSRKKESQCLKQEAASQPASQHEKATMICVIVTASY